ncbi:hypothetical protein CCHL11_00712 [Colletotrichum chlorophyti]|uniref:Fasciclin domain family protein n=1 Tax=Colletotrichum chlorophyti TaxID=708187 RepID=A0A1Q8S5D7_9PEZI|nr:hypothetical protein CCHL11_00712 [Colletotrichum chlorophyti]
MTMTTHEQPASQASSHFPLEPISAATLCSREIKRRDALVRRGNVKVGCQEVDEFALLGGLERGSVVGISAEGEQFGLMISLQALARTLCDGASRGMVVTTQPPAGILPALRDAVKAELVARGTSDDEVQPRLKSCLERVSVSRVFDLQGLWEVLGDLDIPPADSAGEEDVVEDMATLSRLSTAEQPREKVVLTDLKPGRTEVADSDDEDAVSVSSELSPPPSVIRTPTPFAMEFPDHIEGSDGHKEPQGNGLPNIIMVTHFHSLLTALFTRQDRLSAHTSLQCLSSHLRYLARELPSKPLIFLLNSTSSTKDNIPPTKQQESRDWPLLNHGPNGGADGGKPLDPTLRSIFNPPPMNLAGYGTRQAMSRRNKPTFGLVFSQLLDMHLLCTRVPRDKEDAERVYAAPPGRGEEEVKVRYTWIVEVLLDEIGVWEGRRGQRKGREQRWGAVDVHGGRVVDAFASEEERARKGEVRVAGGFGGPRV